MSEILEPFSTITPEERRATLAVIPKRGEPEPISPVPPGVCEPDYQHRTFGAPAAHLSIACIWDRPPMLTLSQSES